MDDCDERGVSGGKMLGCEPLLWRGGAGRVAEGNLRLWAEIKALKC